MAFDFQKAITDSKKQSNALMAIILGQQGGGKSSIMGTLEIPTLYLHTTGESHGVKSIRTKNSKIVPVAIDQDNGKQLTPDQAYEKLLDILNSVEGIIGSKFKAVCLDGASELEFIIRNTGKWKSLCLSTTGKHNTYAESSATITLFRPVINALKNLQTNHDINIAMSCILDVKALGEYGEIEESTPKLLGYAVAESLIQQFDDVLVVGKMKNGDEKRHMIQMLNDVTKTSKDLQGHVKKTINYSPRIAGLLLQDTPAYIEADLKEVLKLKDKK